VGQNRVLEYNTIRSSVNFKFYKLNCTGQSRWRTGKNLLQFRIAYGIRLRRKLATFSSTHYTEFATILERPCFLNLLQGTFAAERACPRPPPRQIQVTFFANSTL
jgi:hypothetical protein